MDYIAVDLVLIAVVDDMIACLYVRVVSCSQRLSVAYLQSAITEVSRRGLLRHLNIIDRLRGRIGPVEVLLSVLCCRRRSFDRD